MHLSLIDTNQEVTDAWESVFADVPQVTVRQGSIFACAADALISPANSFGYMNGGLDLGATQIVALPALRVALNGLPRSVA